MTRLHRNLSRCRRHCRRWTPVPQVAFCGFHFDQHCEQFKDTHNVVDAAADTCNSI